MFQLRAKIMTYLTVVLGLTTLSSAQATVTGNVIVSDDLHYVEPLNESAPALMKRIDMIRHAKGSIEIEVWDFDLSRSSRLLLRELIAKKQAMPSVQIRLLVDYYVTGGLAVINPAVAQALEKYGIQVKYYNLVPKEDLVDLNHRDHSKLFITDGSELIIGSRNLGDEHFGLGKGLNYIDTDFWVDGPIVRSIQTAFYEFWNSALATNPDPSESWGYGKPENLTYVDDSDRALADKVEKLGMDALNNSMAYEVHHLEFVKDGPLNVDSQRKVTEYVNSKLQKVTHSLLMENWGFVPDKNRISIMNDLMSEGVRIQVLTNGIDAHLSETLAGMGWVQQKKEIPKGLQLSYYRSAPDEPHLDSTIAMLPCVYETHSKTAVRDMRYVDVGSYNWDGRSENINHEDLLSIDSPEVAQAISALIQARLAKSLQITADGNDQGGQSLLPDFLQVQGIPKWLMERIMGLEEDLVGNEY